MGDLISRSYIANQIGKLKNVIDYHPETGTDPYDAVLLEAENDVIYAVLEELEVAPSIDAEPVKYGRWILNKSVIGLKTYRCNRNGCKDSLFWKERYCYGTENFCPNCGAKMVHDSTKLI